MLPASSWAAGRRLVADIGFSHSVLNRCTLLGYRVRECRSSLSSSSLSEPTHQHEVSTGEGNVNGVRKDENTILLDADAKYTAEEGTVYMTGLQALVRLPMVVRDRDAKRGFNTAGFISGYRGSPLGAYDQQLWAAKKHLFARNIELQPGVNEEIAATAVWGSQQVTLHHDKTVDGVFGIWYGKGPGVDRSGDAIKHANLAGTSQLGGVVAVAGDDHACKSSTVPHQSELNLRDMNVPTLVPSSVAEVLSLGVAAVELSRFSGCWVGMKVTSQVMDSGSTVVLGPELEFQVDPGGPGPGRASASASASGLRGHGDPRLAPPSAEEFAMPAGGLNIRLPDDWNAQEARLYAHKLPAVTAFWKKTRLDRRIFGVSGDTRPKLAIVSAGTTALDVVEALEGLLGIDQVG